MNATIDYYNDHAEEYFAGTAGVDLAGLYERFLAQVPCGGRIMDLGCGSGRDVRWFRDHGYDARGLDASAELVRIARDNFGILVECGLIEDWIADEPFDGIWCCASLMHMDDASIAGFAGNLKHNLRPGGVLYLSVKSGVETGSDERGRYFRDFTEDDIRRLAEMSGMTVGEIWYTEDKLARNNFKWLNGLMIRER